MTMKITLLDGDSTLNEASCNRILSHLQTDNLATIASYITGDNSMRLETPKKRSNKQNKEMLKGLSKDLNTLGYSFIEVRGMYKQADQEEPVKETTLFALCPAGYFFKQFRMDMINLSRKYEQESVVVWDHEEQKATLYGTSDFKTYKKWDTFDKLSINTPALIWTKFKSNWFIFENDSLDEEILGDFKIHNTDLDPTAPVYRIAHYRKEMFGKWY